MLESDSGIIQSNYPTCISVMELSSLSREIN